MPSFRQPPFRQSPKQSSRQTSRQPARLSSPSMHQMQECLQVLRRPVVWGSAAVLLAAGYFLSPYWSNFNPIAQTRSQSPSTPRQNPLYSPQTADPANLNGFGNMPGLGSSTGQQGSLEQSGISGSTPMPSAGQQSGSLDPFAVPGSQDSTLGAAPGLPTPASSALNPSGLSTSGLNSNSGAGGTSFIQGSFGTPTSGSSTSGNSTSGNSTSGSSTLGNSTSSSSVANPLPSALDRATHSTSTPSTNSTLEPQPNSDLPSTLTPGTSAPSTGITTAPTSPSTTPSTTATTPLSPVGQSSFQPYTPPTSSGASGTAVPPAFRTPANAAPAASSSGFSNFSKPQPLPGNYSAPSNPPYATQPMLPSSRSSSSSSYASPSGTQAAQPFSTP